MGVGWPKISGRRGRPPPTILLLRELAKCSFVWHKNLDRSFFRFVTIHACDRQTDRRTEISSQYRVCITCSAVKNLIAEYLSLCMWAICIFDRCTDREVSHTRNEIKTNGYHYVDLWKSTNESGQLGVNRKKPYLATERLRLWRKKIQVSRRLFTRLLMATIYAYRFQRLNYF